MNTEYQPHVRNNSLYEALAVFVRKGIDVLKEIIDILEIAKKQNEIDKDRMMFVASISSYSHFNIVRYLINGQKIRLTSLEEYQKCD